MIKKYYKKIESYVQEVVIELKNVTWPTWNDLKSTTLIVFVTTLILTIFIGIVDRLLAEIITRIIGIV